VSRKRVLWLAVLALAGIAFLSAAPPQTFEGQLEEVYFKAPDFPPPTQMPVTQNPSSPLDRTMTATQTAPQGPVPTPQSGVPPATVGMPPPSPEATQPQPQPSFTSTGITWINSRPLTMEQLRGKVVMIDFWEYTCINCIRTLADNKKWYERYRGDGFVLIGVHDPEFNIAYSVKNVREAVKRFGITYPVVVDDKFMIWNLYHSNSWPNRFLIDAKGYVRYHRVGEGGDGAFEHAIQKLLQEAHPGLKFPASYDVPPEENAFSPACGVTTPEMYVGDWFGRGVLENPEGYEGGKTVDYKAQDSVEDGHVVLEGKWRTEKDGMTYRGKKGSQDAELIMKYHARELYSVMNVAHGHPERLYITQDGKDLTRQNKGVDVRFDSQGHSYLEVREPRMYYLVQNPSSGSHTVILKPSAPGITINSFTFGNNCQTNFPHL